MAVRVEATRRRTAIDLPLDGFITVALADLLGIYPTEPTQDNCGVQPAWQGNLTPHAGDFVFTSDGQVVEGLDISGRVIFGNTSNTVLRNCIVRGGPSQVAYGSDWMHIQCYGTTGTNRLIEFCEVRPSHPSVDTYGVHGWGYTLRRSVVVDVVDCANVHRSPSGAVHSAVIESSYLANLWYSSDPRQSDGSHCDISQMFSGSTIRFEGNACHGVQRKSNGVVLTPNSTTGAAQLKAVRIRKNRFYGSYTQISVWDSNGTTFDDIPGLVIGPNEHVGARGSTGTHQWDLLITAGNRDAATSLVGYSTTSTDTPFMHVNN